MPRSLAVTKRRRGNRRAATKRFRGGAPKRRGRRAAAAKSLEVKGPADAKKALELMGKHPMVLILVFANWCPHCHKFMEQWNKYEQTPNRKSPMIRVEQANMGALLPHIKQPDGKPMEVDGFPTVLLNMNKGAVQGNRGAPSENVGTVITDPRNEEFMSNLIKNGASTVMADEEESEEPSDVAVPAASAPGSTTTVPTMGTTALNASHYDESMESSQLTNRYRNNNLNEPNNSNLLNNSNMLSNNVKSAIQSASNSAKRAAKEAKSVRRAGSAELSDASARGSFAAPPAKEVSTMSGGAGTCGAPPSGSLMKGGYSKSDTLLAQLRELVGKN
jgi:hypothetical protein